MFRRAVVQGRKPFREPDVGSREDIRERARDRRDTLLLPFRGRAEVRQVLRVWKRIVIQLPFSVAVARRSRPSSLWKTPEGDPSSKLGWGIIKPKVVVQLRPRATIYYRQLFKSWLVSDTLLMISIRFLEY